MRVWMIRVRVDLVGVREGGSSLILISLLPCPKYTPRVDTVVLLFCLLPNHFCSLSFSSIFTHINTHHHYITKKSLQTPFLILLHHAPTGDPNGRCRVS